MADQLLSVEGFADEKRSVEDIRRRIQLSRLFRIYDEVQGKSIGLWHIQTQRRIDMILVPTPEAIAAGWNEGFVGVECKRSGKTLDEAMHQAITYMDTVWTLGDWRGLVVLSSVFVWPYYWPAKSAGYAARMQYSRVGVIEPMMRDGYRMIRKEGQPMLSWTPQAGLKTVLE
jgi:hypothetical protein